MASFPNVPTTTSNSGVPAQAAQQNEDSLHAKNIPSFEPPSAASNTVLHLSPPIHQLRAQNQNHDFDRTGQIAPPGIKPRVTTSLWEDEGSLCFQVEARGIVVARRQVNNYINGTKLFNVAGMTRGRRDGILKAENIKHVVKTGPIHLKGVWIPFERALDFANREKITPLLYPLFVHDIDTLLYHLTNQNRGNQIMATAERRKQQQAGDRKNEQSLGHTSHGRGIVEAQHQMSPSSVLSPESDSDSSSSGEFLAREKRKDMLTNSLMNDFFRVFRSCRSSLTPSRVKTHGTGIDETTTGMNIDSASTLTSRSSQTLGKRERTEDKGDEDEDYAASDRRGKRPLMGDPLPRPKRLACPYFKKDPVRFQTKQSCCGPGWETVHRLKEHLDRNHCLPISCLRCYAPFETEAERDSHMRSAEQCELRQPPNSIAGFNASQRAELKSRPRGLKNMSEPQKWRRVYLILFPGTLERDIPSPYYEFETSREPGHPVDLMMQYEEYLEQELPLRVRQQLEIRIEQALHPVEESLRGQLVEIVRDVQLELFRSFRTFIRPGRADGAQDSTRLNTGTCEDQCELNIEHQEPGPSNQEIPAIDAAPEVSEVSWSLEDALAPWRPEPYLDWNLDGFDRQFFDFRQTMLSMENNDSAYETLSSTDNVEQKPSEETQSRAGSVDHTRPQS